MSCVEVLDAPLRGGLVPTGLERGGSRLDGNWRRQSRGGRTVLKHDRNGG